MVCVWCQQQVPLPENRGEDAYCQNCGKVYRLYETEEIWYATTWEKYKPVEQP